MIRFNKPLKDIEQRDKFGFRKPTPGGYIMQCTAVELSKSKSGNDMMILSLDIAEGEFFGAFAIYPLKHYVLIDENSPWFKGLITSFLRSNVEFFTEEDLNSVEFDETKLIGMYVGAVLKNEEYIAKDGKVKKSLKVNFICSTETIKTGDYKVLDAKVIDPNELDDIKYSDKETEDEEFPI